MNKIELNQLPSIITNGACIGIGGDYGLRRPFALVRELAKNRVKDLTVVTFTVSLEVDLLVACGCVKAVLAPFLGEKLPREMYPFLSAAINDRSIEFLPMDETLLVTMLKGAALGLPFMTWKPPDDFPGEMLAGELAKVPCPYSGEIVYTIPAIQPDVTLSVVGAIPPEPSQALAHANIKEQLLCQAANTILYQSEQINNPLSVFKPGDIDALPPAELAIELPFGVLPFMHERYYFLDQDVLNSYLEAALQHTQGNSALWDDFVQRWIDSPADYWNYLGRYGRERLSSLTVNREFWNRIEGMIEDEPGAENET